MIMNRCISCEKEISTYPCPHCGFDISAYQQPEYALPCGTVLNGRYLVGKVLGQGGFGITYVGWDLALEIKVAIKEYFPNGQVTRSAANTNLVWYTNAQSKALRQNGMESFLKEARKMAKVEQIQEVVRVRDTFVENETAYIIMDFAEGQTLKSYLEKNGILNWDKAQKIFLPVIAAMEQVHKAGIIHRDISPDNLMLLSNGGVKILDLGAAKDLSVNNGASSMQVIKGGFSPIEQYGSTGDSGPWTDVYAMAATMYYSLTGKMPPTAPDRLGAFINQKKDSLEWDLPQLNVLPKNIKHALQRAMVVSATKRSQSMDELLKQMQESPKQKMETQKQPKKRKKAVSKPKKKVKSIRMGVIAACIAAVGLAILIWPNGKILDNQTLNPERLAEESTVCPPTVESTAENETSGNLGSNLQWTLDEAGVLTISGQGSMQTTKDLPKSFRQTVKKVELEEGITSVSTEAFQNYSNLIEVTLPDSVQTIGDAAFRNCDNLSNVRLSKNLTVISEKAFVGCRNLTEILLPDGLKAIGKYAFTGCTKLKSISIPQKVTQIEGYVFSGCENLLEAELPDGVRLIGQYAFNGCKKLMSITIPESVYSIKDHAFQGCKSLTQVILPLGLREICGSAFASCNNLSKIDIPASVVRIDDHAFESCYNLKNITVSRDCNVAGSAFWNSISLQIDYY